MGKRKFDSDDRMSKLVSSMTDAQAAGLQHQDELPTNLKCLAPLLESIRQAYEAAALPPKTPIRPATEFKGFLEVAETLGIDYKRDSLEHIYSLKETAHSNAKELSPHFASVIKDIKTSNYVGTRSDESLSRTVLDLILVDRLQHLEDRDAFHQLILSAEVPVSVNIKGDDGKPELIKGRADWVLGYGKTKANTGSILMIVEAKGYGSASIGLAQMLIYMAAVHEARLEYTNNSVFGMLSDSTEFRFAFLDSNKKFYLSYTLYWIKDQQAIISYIDAMLLDAIQSSPYTTPTKIQNKTLCRYPQYLKGKWAFGDDAEDEVETEEEIYEDDIVDVVKVNGNIVLRKMRRD